MNKIILIFLLNFLLAANGLQARSYTPETVPNVNKADRREFVSDPEGLVSPETKSRLNAILSNLRQQTTAEMAIVVVPTLGDIDPETFATELFANFGLGKADKDNGILLLIAPDDRTARIETGYGVEGVIPAAAAGRIIRYDIAPHMQKGDLDNALLAATDRIAKAMTDPSAAEYLRSEQGNGYPVNSLDSEVMSNFVGYVVVLMLLIAIILFISDIISLRRKTPYDKALLWKRHTLIFLVLGILSCGIGLIFALIAWLLAKRYRSRPVICDTCGAKMHKLSEENDNELLNASQDFEEKLNTVDYDVWECPDCGTIERFPFKIKQSTYTECPRCHTIAFCLTLDKTITSPTTAREGLGEKHYHCKFCNYDQKKTYRIPRKQDDALATAVIVGSMLGGRGGGGGGGFGGGFGGGMSGGGGATGHW